MIKISRKNDHILKNFNYGFYLIIFIWLITGFIYFYDSSHDQKLIFITKNPVNLYQDSNLYESKKIGTITPGDHVKVLRVLFIKDHLAILIQTNTQRGWILKDDNVDLKYTANDSLFK